MTKWTVPGVLLTVLFLLSGVWTALGEGTRESNFLLCETACAAAYGEVNLPENEADGQNNKTDASDSKADAQERRTEASNSKTAAQSGKININTADISTLTQLPGIGEVKARAIVSYREAHGAFASEESIMQVSGIKEGTYSKLKDYITVGGT